MPIYDYECATCGRFEATQPITAEPLAACPTCGSPVRRLISLNPNIIFKGSGFYKNDSRSTDYQKRSKEESSASPEKEKAS